ncbi:MAG TPA: Ig-like domain repeat protein, partial [Ktedonobacterales bacterium]|nr:Ig-like domain repeat protein [Ktedonobacterales bacterium]
PALDNLQQQAITNTLADHGLPSSEAMAVQGWARDDAEAELYALLVQAASTPACSSTQTPGNNCRTADQQNAVQWLADMAQREGVQEAYYAGLEYVKWAGLSQATYNSDVNAYKADVSAGKDTTTDKTNLENFLNQGFTAPADYSCADGTTSCIDTTSLATIQATATEGFCVYKSPTPYQSDYQGNAFSGTDSSMPAICDEPGGGIGCLIDCNPDTPAYGDFVRWGEADANYALVDSFDYTETAHDIALGIGLGGVAFAVATGAALGATLPGVMLSTAVGSAFVSAVFPEAGFVTSLSPVAYAAAAANGTATAASATAETAALNAGVMGASGIGIIAGAVLIFVAGTTAEVIQLAADSQLPGQVATLLEDSPTQGYDPGSMVGDQNGGAGELYSLFVNATLPSPLTNCTQYTPVSNPVCLDPPPPAAPDLQNDPEFSVSENAGAATTQPSITWYDKVSQATATARVHNTWFLEQATDNHGNPLAVMDNDGVIRPQMQTLRILYTDWNGNEQTAELVNDPKLGYEFVTVQLQPGGTTLDPSKCAAANTCAYSNTINFVDSAGNKYSASLVKPVFPTVTTPTFSPQNPVEGQAVKLQSTVGPASGSFAETWTIQDKPVNPPITICGTPTAPAPCPPPTVTVSGANPSYTFPTSGSFAVTVTASDSVGRSASSTATVTVGDVAPKVSPYGACHPSLFSNTCLFPYNDPIVTPGSQTTLGGAIVHAGSEDVESLDVNWGDGSTDDTVSNQGLCAQFGSLCDANLSFDYARQSVSSTGVISLPFAATHTYANPGTYTVTLTDTDQSGAQSKTTFTESALYGTTTIMSASTVNPSVYGQQVKLTATVSATGASAAPTGTVTFYDGATTLGVANLSTSNGVTSATLSVSNLPIGKQTITAAYSGDGGKAFQPSSDPQGMTQTVNKAATSTSLSSNPTASVWGQSVTFTATVHVTSPGAGNPGGTVEFKDGASDISGCGARPVDTTSETATCTTAALSVASHSVTAIYSGDTNFAGSATASADTQVVSKANASATVSASSGAVTQGQAMTFTATVSAVSPGAGTPTGTVTFYDGATSIGTGSLSASGGVDQATFSSSSLAVGAHTITASYGGDGNFKASATSPSITVYINTNLGAYPKLPSGAYDLSNSDLSGAYLVGLSLAGAQVVNTNLTGAVLIGANLTGADLSNSNLKGADFMNVNLSGANLTNSNLLGATGLNTATLTGVIWYKTECPDGTLSNHDGGTCVGHL